MKRLDPSRDAAHLWDILQAAQLIQTFVSKISFETYCKDPLKSSAVERQLEIIGEAAKRLTEDFRKKHAAIPWRAVIGQRNILAHEYGTVDPSLVWETATVQIPILIKHLTPLLPPIPSEEP